MFFILKVILIILLNETYAYITQDSEIILLPAWNPTGRSKISLTLKAFGNQIQLNLRRNDQIVSSAFKVWKHNAKGIMEELSQLNTPDPCYYFHDDHVNTAAIDFCQEHGLKGVVFLENTTLDITPLQNNWVSSSLIGDSCFETETNVSFGKPHLIKRSPRQADWDQYSNPTSPPLTIELAVLLDHVAYNKTFPLVGGSDVKIRNMILAYINGLQTIFRHPSLGIRIDIVLTGLTLLGLKNDELPYIGNDVDQLLKSFCNHAYWYLHVQSPYHPWDIALYLTGLDLYRFYQIKPKGVESDQAFRGSSVLNGSCKWQSSCAVVEFGVSCNKAYEKPCKPEAGFASIYNAAHEIGRLLGMKHDNTMNNECSKDDYIMTDIRGGFHAPAIWSTCSREVAAKLWKTKQCLLDKPTYNSYYVALQTPSTPSGSNPNVTVTYNQIKKEWTAKKQCELYLQNRDANVVTLLHVCEYLQCEELNKINYFLFIDYYNLIYKFKYYYFFAGPALDGTHCAPDKECQNRECVPISTDDFVKPIMSNTGHSKEGHWSEWKEGSCKSSCLEKSRGVIDKRRICWDKNNRSENCKGESYDVKLCYDSALCSQSDKPRLPINKFVDMTCEEYKLYFPHLNLTGKGIQDIYDFNEPSLACTIFCLQKQENDYVANYYAPRIKVTALGYDPYLPDGTWCHTKNNQDYFCRKRLCLPEN